MVKGEGKEEAVERLQSSTEQMDCAEGDTAVCAPGPRLWPEFSLDQASTSAAAGGVSTQDAWEAFILENWAPALQAALGDQWKQQFANDARSLHHLTGPVEDAASFLDELVKFPSDGVPMPAFASAAGSQDNDLMDELGFAAFEGSFMLPGCASRVTEKLDQDGEPMHRNEDWPDRSRASDAYAMDEELQRLEMTAGISGALRAPRPRRPVRIVRHPHPAASAAPITAAGKPGNDPSERRSRPASSSTSNPKQGQKRSANSLFSDATRQINDEMFDSSEGTQPSSPSTCSSEELKPSFASNVGTATPALQAPQHSLHSKADAQPWGPGGDGARQERPVLLSRSLLDSEDCWGRSPLHMAAAKGRADVVRHLLYAGCDASKWLRVDYRLLQEAAQQPLSRQRAEGGIGSSQETSPITSEPPGNSESRPSVDGLEDGISLLNIASDSGKVASSASTSSRTSADYDADSTKVRQPGQRTEWLIKASIASSRDGQQGSTQDIGSAGQALGEVSGGLASDMRGRASGSQPPQILPLSFHYCTALHLAAFHGHWEVVDVLLTSASCDLTQLLTARNIQGCTALHMAAHEGHVEAVSCMCRMLQCQVDAVDNEGRTALHHAAALGHNAVVMELWGRGCDIELADSIGWTALHHAAAAGQTEVVGMLVIAGSNVQRVEARGLTAAHLAAIQGHAAVLDKLLMAGYDVDTLGSVAVLGGMYNSGSSALHLAARNGHLQMVEKLLQAGASAALPDYRGCGALHCAAEGGHLEVFNRLLEAGADPNGVDQLGATVLHAAAQGGNWQIVQRLLDLACEASATTHHGRSVLHYAAYSGRADVLEKLVELGCDVEAADEEGNKPWHAAAQSSNVAAVQQLLKLGCQIEASNRNKCTALHYAARSGSLEMVELLLHNGALQGTACSDGRTALHYASQAGHARIVQRLVREAGVDLVNQRDQAAWTPLHYAAEHGGIDVVCLLLEAGSEVNVQTAEGWSPLHLAAKERCIDVVGTLLLSGADGSFLDNNGCTALHYAVQLADVDLFQTLYSQPGCPSSLRDSKGYTVLHYAVEGGSLEIVQALLGTGHGPSQQDPPPAERDFTPLHLASRVGHVALIPVLLEAGYPADGVDREGRTPLHCAALGSQASWLDASQSGMLKAPVPAIGGMHHEAVVNLLLETGVDPKALDDASCSALHYAAGSGDTAALERLLQLGCSLLAIDKIGWSPLMWAASGGHAATLRALMAAGADVRIRDVRLRGALHWAAEKGHVEAVGILVDSLSELQLDLHAQDADGYSAAQLAANQGHVEVVGRILDGSRMQTQKGFSALHLAVQNGLDRLVQQLLALPNSAPDARDVDGATPLHWAAAHGFTSIVELLLQAGCDVIATDNEGSTALHKAAASGHAEVVQRILSISNQVNLKTTSGATALQHAAAEGNGDVVDLLLKAGCAMNLRALNNVTALYNAANGGHLAIVRRLLDAGAEADAATTSGSTALHAAASNGHAEVVEALLQAGADPDVQAQNGSTAMHNAAANGHDAVAESLIAAASDVDVQNSGGNTALHVAASKGHTRVVELLLAADANPHIKNSKAWTAVHSGASGGHFEAVLRLVQNGAAWRNSTDCNVLKTICRKTSYKASYVEGRLRLAEKERQRVKSKSDAGRANGEPTKEQLKQLKDEADAHMAALLNEEKARKELEESKRAKKKEKKKKKGKRDNGNISEEEDEAAVAEHPAAEEGNSLVPTEAPLAPLEPPAISLERPLGRLGEATVKQADVSSSQPTKHPPKSQRGKKTDVDQRQAAEAGGQAQAAGQVRNSGSATVPKAANRAAKGKKGVRGAEPSSNKTADDGEWVQVGPAGRAQSLGTPSTSLEGGTAQAAKGSQRKGRSRQDAADVQLGRQAGTRNGSHTDRTANPSHEYGKASQPKGKASAKDAASQPSPRVKPAAELDRQSHQHRSGPGRQQHHVGEAAATTRTPAVSAHTAVPHAAAKHEPPPLAANGPLGGANAVGSGRPAALLTPAAQAVHTRLPLSRQQPPPPAKQPGQARHPAPLPIPRRDAAARVGQPLSHRDLPPASAQPAESRPTRSAPQSPIRQVLQMPSNMQQAVSAAAPAPPMHNLQQSMPLAASAGLQAQNGLNSAAPAWQPSASPPVDWSWGGSQARPPPVPQGAGGSPSRRPSFGRAISSNSLAQDAAGAALAHRSQSLQQAAKAASLDEPSAQHWSASRPVSNDSDATVRPSPVGGPRTLQGPAELREKLENIWGSPVPEQGGPPGFGGRAPMFGPPVINGQHPRDLLEYAAQERERPAVKRTLALGLLMPDGQGQRVWGSGELSSAAMRQAGRDGQPSEVNMRDRMARIYGLCCPLTNNLMREPVVASDGYTYERSAIEGWLMEHDTSPITKTPLPGGSKDLVPNLTMRSAIALLIPRH